MPQAWARRSHGLWCYHARSLRGVLSSLTAHGERGAKGRGRGPTPHSSKDAPSLPPPPRTWARGAAGTWAALLALPHLRTARPLGICPARSASEQRMLSFRFKPASIPECSPPVRSNRQTHGAWASRGSESPPCLRFMKGQHQDPRPEPCTRGGGPGSAASAWMQAEEAPTPSLRTPAAPRGSWGRGGVGLGWAGGGQELSGGGSCQEALFLPPAPANTFPPALVGRGCTRPRRTL